MLERIQLTHAAGRAAKTFSRGMRRRVDLAASPVGRPSILFLDEPTTGLPRTSAVSCETAARPGRVRCDRPADRAVSERGSPTASW
ncbi:ATP-binding cassette domain-containing protein [Streptomyces sp. DH10]|nr:ATP-binding cassette domain-containing protein [Streptomyces sp. DH10]MDG9707791.1 ATP-binding cassette domain-containing protein [Streptomyces sp. DH10]